MPCPGTTSMLTELTPSPWVSLLTTSSSIASPWVIGVAMVSSTAVGSACEMAPVNVKSPPSQELLMVYWPDPKGSVPISGPEAMMYSRVQ